MQHFVDVLIYPGPPFHYGRGSTFPLKYSLNDGGSFRTAVPFGDKTT